MCLACTVTNLFPTKLRVDLNFFGKATELTKHRIKFKADESEECNAKLKHTLHDLTNKDLNVYELEKELHNHGKQRTAKKADLLQRLI